MCRYSFLFLALFFLSLSAFSQEIVCVENSSTSIISVDTAPIIEECDELKDTKECFKKSLRNFLLGNMSTSSTSKTDDPVYLFFIVSKDGNITDVQVRTDDEAQKEEIEKLLNLLNIKHPATVRGQEVSMQYFSVIDLKK